MLSCNAESTADASAKCSHHCIRENIHTSSPMTASKLRSFAGALVAMMAPQFKRRGRVARVCGDVGARAISTARRLYRAFTFA